MVEFVQHSLKQPSIMQFATMGCEYEETVTLRIVLVVIIAICAIALLGIFAMVIKGLLQKLMSVFFILVGLIGTLWLAWFYVPQLKEPGNVVADLMQGKWAQSQNQLSQANLFYQKALPNFPYREWIYEWLGDLALQQGNKAHAIEQYQQALLVNDNDKAVRLKLARLEWEAGHENIALALYQDALEADPGNTKLYESIGNLYLSRAQKTHLPEDYESAIRTLQPVFQKHPEDTALGFSLGSLLYDRERYEEALTVYCDLSVTNPTSAEALYAMALTMEKLGASKSASVRMAQAAENNTNVAQAQNWVATSLRMRQRSDSDPPNHSVVSCLNRLKTPYNK